MKIEKNIHVSIVTPVYGEKLSLDILYRKLVEALSEITDDFEIIMVNDHSPDNSWQVIEELARKDSRVRGINLSRNFGQHYAITAGLSYVRGDWCVIMDCDLQDRPEEIHKLYNRAQQGFDIVVGRRSDRQDSFLNIATSKLFYAVFNYLTDQKLDSSVANFGIYSKQVVSEMLRYKEIDRSLGLLSTVIGFNRSEVDVVHGKRTVGKSAYTFRMRWQMAQDHIFTHSTKPLKLVTKAGVLVTIITLFYAIKLVVSYLFGSATPAGWNSIMVTMFLLFGITLISLGIMGLYVGKIFEQVKARPLYIVRGTTFDDSKNKPSYD